MRVNATMENKLRKIFKKIIKNALQEDAAYNDITSDITVKNKLIKFKIATRQDIVLCGTHIVDVTFDLLKTNKKFKNSDIKFKILKKDGQKIKSGDVIAEGFGDARIIFAAERVILNFIQHLSSISSFTDKFVTELNNKKIKILDTRKTTPGLRTLEKYAVKTGNGFNHRQNLKEMILIKDNHIAAADGIINALNLVEKNNKKLKVEVECDNIKQVSSAILFNPEIIMLDNMSIEDIKKSIKIINKKAFIEVSGGVNLNNIKKYRKLEIDYISIGAITHSAPSVDIGLDIK